MSEVFELLSRIPQAQSVESVWDLCVAYYQRLGFDRASYGYTLYRSDHSIGDPNDALFLCSGNEAESMQYFDSGFYARTPMFRWVAQNEGVSSWRWVEEAYIAGNLSPSEADCVRKNLEQGIVAGLSIGFPVTSSRRKGALGLKAAAGLGHDDVDRIWAIHSQKLTAVANMMHLKITQLPLATRRRPLTERQREALEWVADGKTTQDIAVIMGVSTAMVEKHLRLARETLDVETTAQAVAKGASLNRIFQKSNRASEACPSFNTRCDDRKVWNS